MKLERIAFALVLAVVACFVAPSAPAQETTGKPITVKVKTPKPPKPKVLTFKGEVLHMDGNSIVVRDPKNTAIVKTFSYTPAVAKKLQKRLARGGYPYGERVSVKYAQGTSVAQGISAKAPKAARPKSQ
jgi:hypothetical protein